MTHSRIVITGGAGFVGSQLGYHLAQAGHEVVLLDNMSFGRLDNLVIEGKTFGTLVVRDVRDSDLATHFKNTDTVFHFAGVAALPMCQINPQLAFDINTSAVANVLESARRAGVRRVLFSSTSAVYENSKAERYSEEVPVCPDLIYAMTKHGAEQICSSYAQLYDMDVITVRFFNLYGPHQDFKRLSPPFTSYIARELAANRAPKLFNQSDAKRDYVNVSDVISLLVKMMQSTRRYRGDIYNIGSGTSYSVPELYQKMCTIAGKDIPAQYGDPQGYWDAYPQLFEGNNKLSRERIVKEVYKSALADITKTTKEFDWSPKVSIDDGLKAVYEYARAHA